MADVDDHHTGYQALIMCNFHASYSCFEIYFSDTNYSVVEVHVSFTEILNY